MYLVAHDGSEYAKGGLLRAVEYADLTNVDVEAFSVIPDSARYANERGWIGTREDYELRSIVQELHEQVTTLAPEATFEYETIDGYAGAGSIAQEIRRRAVDRGAEVVFIGSEHAGRVATSVSSVGGSVAAEQEYDVLIVRTSPRLMTDLDEERRRAWLREDDRTKPSWRGDTLYHPTPVTDQPP